MHLRLKVDAGGTEGADEEILVWAGGPEGGKGGVIPSGPGLEIGQIPAGQLRVGHRLEIIGTEHGGIIQPAVGLVQNQGRNHRDPAVGQ